MSDIIHRKMRNIGQISAEIYEKSGLTMHIKPFLLFLCGVFKNLPAVYQTDSIAE